MSTLVNRSWLAVAAAIALGGGVAQAAVPNASVLEATLHSTGGGPAADGNYAITFSIYKDANDASPLWSEGPIQIPVSNGQFSHVLGSSTPLKPALLAAGGWLSFKIGTDPALPAKPLNASLFALRAAVAEAIDCSGCIPAAAIDGQAFAAYAKKSDLSGVALSGNYADLAGLPSLPSLSGYVKAADLAKIATTGAWSDLQGKPTLPALGKSCGTGLVVAGLKADGSLECVQGGSSSSLPNDGIDEISNGLIFNQFTDVFKNAKPVPIPDNFPLGVGDTIVVPDVGVAQKLSISLQLANSDITGVSVTLFDPNNVQYVLYNKTGKKGDGIITTYPDNTLPFSGDIAGTWVGKNPKGTWSLQVIDTAFKDNKSDGQVTSWSINVQTLSNKKIQVKGDLIVEGNLTVNGTSIVPAGAVIPFKLSACPSGWIAADGANSTPDLRGRFPIGVGALPQGGSVGLAATGGSHTYRIGNYGQKGPSGAHSGGGAYGYPTNSIGFEWQGEAQVTRSSSYNSWQWSGFTNHLPPYTGLLYCVKQ